MSKLRVTGPILPKASTDTYPTHLAQFQGGGMFVARSLSERNTISVDRRTARTTCLVLNTGSGESRLYKLNVSANPSQSELANNANWVEVPIGTEVQGVLVNRGFVNANEITLADGVGQENDLWIVDTGGVVETPTLFNGAATTLTVGDFLIYYANKWKLLPTGAQAVTWSTLTGKPTTFPPSPHTHDWTEIDNRPNVDNFIEDSRITSTIPDDNTNGELLSDLDGIRGYVGQKIAEIDVPDLDDYYTKEQVDSEIEGAVEDIDSSKWEDDGATTIKPKDDKTVTTEHISGLSAVATSNDYEDLDNKPDLSQSHTQNTDTKLAEDTADEVSANQIKGHIESVSNPHDVTKAQVGLSNVDNTSDEDKPVSTATQAALDDIENNNLWEEVDPLNVNIGFGFLYNWFAIEDAREITSTDDWRVPTETELEDLHLYFGGDNQSVLSLKLKGTGFGWDNLLQDIPEQFNFNLVGAGLRGSGNGSFNSFRTDTEIWSSTSKTSDAAANLYFGVYPLDPYSNLGSTNKKAGNTVRLIRDASVEEQLLDDGTIIEEAYTGNNAVVYHGVKIDDKVWLGTNLKETLYRNSDAIPNVTDNTDWSNLSTGAYSIYDNEEEPLELVINTADEIRPKGPTKRIDSQYIKNLPSGYDSTDFDADFATKTTDELTEGDKKFVTQAEKDKLAGIEAGAEVNEVNAADIANFETTTQLNTRDTANRNRDNHTGNQLASTISDFSGAVKSELGLKQTSGVVIAFNEPKKYGYPTAETGNITFDFTNAIEGMTQVLRHNSGTEPTMPASKIVLGGSYLVGENNYIYLTPIKVSSSPDVWEVHTMFNQNQNA